MHADRLATRFRALRVGMLSWTLGVLCRAAWPGRKTTQSVEDGIPTQSMGTSDPIVNE